MLAGADVLLYVGFGGPKRPGDVHGWQQGLALLPNKIKALKTSSHPANADKQKGAVYAVHLALQSGWFEGFDWVIRVNREIIFPPF